MYKLTKALDRKTLNDVDDYEIIKSLGKMFRLDNLESNTDLIMSELKSVLSESNDNVRKSVNFGKVDDFEYGCSGIIVDSSRARLIFEEYNWVEKIFYEGGF